MSDTCGDCKFFLRWENRLPSGSLIYSGTKCDWRAPRVAGIDGWGKQTPDCRADLPACSVFERVQPVATAGWNVRLNDAED